MTFSTERPDPPPAAGPPPAGPVPLTSGDHRHGKVTGLAGGAALLVAAAFLLLDILGWWVVPQPLTVLACCTAIVGAAVLSEGLHHRRVGVLGWVAVALLVVAVPVTGHTHDGQAESPASPVLVPVLVAGETRDGLAPTSTPTLS